MRMSRYLPLAYHEKLNEKLVALTSELDKKITDQESVIDSKIVLSEEKLMIN